MTDHDHDSDPEWGQWWPVTDTDCVRQCLATPTCQATQESEHSKCRRCGVTIIELPTDYGPGHTEWVNYGNWDEYDPCADEDTGHPIPHVPSLRSISHAD